VPRKTGKIQSNKTILLIVEGETEQNITENSFCNVYKIFEELKMES
jgi:hypothetical protein